MRSTQQQSHECVSLLQCVSDMRSRLAEPLKTQKQNRRSKQRESVANKFDECAFSQFLSIHMSRLHILCNFLRPFCAVLYARKFSSLGAGCCRGMQDIDSETGQFVQRLKGELVPAPANIPCFISAQFPTSLLF